MTNVMQTQELTYTHHMVDDDLTPQDQAMEVFRKAFQLVCNVVAADGKTMRYRFKTESLANVWKVNAEKIINNLNLPLIAKVNVWEKAGLIFEVNLNIIYKPF